MDVHAHGKAWCVRPREVTILSGTMFALTWQRCGRCVRSFAVAPANAKTDGLDAPASVATALPGHAHALLLG